MANGKTIFYGTAGICLPFLEVLRQHTRLSLIITQPDARGGRKRKLLEPPVKTFAREHSIPFVQPDTLKNPEFAEIIAGEEADLAVVIAYGKFIPRKIARMPRCNTINIHFSLLPAYRGAAPVQRAIAAGETVSGVTVFEIASKMDAGPVLGSREVAIEPHSTTPEVFEEMAKAGSSLLSELLPGILNAEICPAPQSNSGVSPAPQISKEEGRIDWRLGAFEIYNRWRAFQPWPGLFFYVNNKMVRVCSCRPGKNSCANTEPGTVLHIDRHRLCVACGHDTCLDIITVQPQCKKTMTSHCFHLGNPLPEKLQ